MAGILAHEDPLDGIGGQRPYPNLRLPSKNIPPELLRVGLRSLSMSVRERSRSLPSVDGKVALQAPASLFLPVSLILLYTA